MTLAGSVYTGKWGRSSALFGRALRVFPGGINHDGRTFSPHPLYFDRAEGSRKWDVDGNEYIDYSLGHGSLILGHGHPSVVAAVNAQLSRGTHYGAAHELEIQWGELVQSMVPCAEQVRFVNSGTEANLLALRLARAFTGRRRVLRFHGHFHGWEDYLTIGARPPFEPDASPGIPAQTLESVVLLPAGDIGLVEEAVRRSDVACVVLEPSGGFWGTVPLGPSFLKDLSDLTRRSRVVLVFDEVVTGFRLAPGGAQQYFGVEPDLCTLAKCLAGGLPGGAVAGRAEVMARLAPRPGDSRWNRYEKISHTGTFNANPISAAAGVAALQILRSGEPQARASEAARKLRSALNLVLRSRSITGFVYGFASFFHIHIGPGADGTPDGTLTRWDSEAVTGNISAQGKVGAVRRAMLERGVDLIRSSGMLSAAHTELDIEQTALAFDATVNALAEAGLLTS